MFTSIEIHNFRGFRRFQAGDLSRVNIVGGANGVGKTSFLEALFLLLGETNLSLVLRAGAFRGILASIEGKPEEIGEWIWGPLFYDFQTEQAIQIQGKWNKKHVRRTKIKVVPRASAILAIPHRDKSEVMGSANGFPSKTLQIEYSSAEKRRARQAVLLIGQTRDNTQTSITVAPPPGPLDSTAYFMAARMAIASEEDAKLFDQLEVAKLTDSFDILGPLRIIEPRLKGLRSITSVGGTMLFADTGLSKLVPLGLLGDGIRRFTSLLLRIATARNGVVLVDEVESGIHYSAMAKVWQAIAEAARTFDVQLFCTTHSFECVRCAHQAFVGRGNYELRYLRLEDHDNNIVAKTFNKVQLETAVKHNLEIR